MEFQDLATILTRAAVEVGFLLKLCGPEQKRRLIYQPFNLRSQCQSGTGTEGLASNELKPSSAEFMFWQAKGLQALAYWLQCPNSPPREPQSKLR